jgi:non-ribosomal peptide synthetase component E (peptide arylation enzyme)
MHPLHVSLRWWKDGNGRGNGHGEVPTNTATHTSDANSSEPEHLAPAPEALWLAQLDREGIPRSLHYPTTTLGRILDQTADRFPDLPALIYGETRWNYREMLAQTNRLAAGLAREGVRAGDRVVLTLPNCPEFVLSFFALQKLGAVVVNAGPLMGADDLRALMALTTPRAVIGLDLQTSQLIDSAGTTPNRAFHLGDASVVSIADETAGISLQALAERRASGWFAQAHDVRPRAGNGAGHATRCGL